METDKKMYESPDFEVVEIQEEQIVCGSDEASRGASHDRFETDTYEWSVLIKLGMTFMAVWCRYVLRNDVGFMFG